MVKKNEKNQRKTEIKKKFLIFSTILLFVNLLLKLK